MLALLGMLLGVAAIFALPIAFGALAAGGSETAWLAAFAAIASSTGLAFVVRLATDDDDDRPRRRGPWMSTMVAICAVLLAACSASCAVDEEPTYAAPRVTVYYEAGTDIELDTAIAAWGDIGVEVAAYDGDDTRPGCPRDWYAQGVTDCEIFIRVREVPTLPPGVLGVALRELREVQVRAGLERPGLVLAHELGHVLLNTGDHADGRGLMAASVQLSSDRLTSADRALACDAVGWCL